jgi:GT2 family glycosyltransferase
MNKRLSIHICTKDRATEVALLLQSLRTQTFQDFNILILDDASQVPLSNFYFVQYIIQRLRIEGHDVKVIRNEESVGVSGARQQLVDFYMENCKEPLSARIDDDSICDSKFLEKLIEGIEEGYDIVGCLVPNFVSPDFKRDIKNVEPIIGECRLNDKGLLIMNFDDCGILYNEEKILPSHHFRSSCMIKREVFEKVNYKSRLSKNGFREETILSFKAILEGFKIGIHTGAICWHLQTPSGGERDTMNMVSFNQQIFEETTKRMFEENGNFIHKYNIDNNLKEKEYTEEDLIKSTNLVTRR